MNSDDLFQQIWNVDTILEGEPSPEVRKRFERLREWGPYLPQYRRILLFLYPIRMIVFASTVAVLGFVLGGFFSSWIVYILAALTVPLAIVAYNFWDLKKICLCDRDVPNGTLGTALFESTWKVGIAFIGIMSIEAFTGWSSTAFEMTVLYVVVVTTCFFELVNVWERRPSELTLMKLSRFELIFRVLINGLHLAVIGAFAGWYFGEASGMSGLWLPLIGITFSVLLTDTANLADGKKFRGSLSEAWIGGVIGLLYGMVALILSAIKYSDPIWPLQMFHFVFSAILSVFGFLVGAKTGLPLGQSANAISKIRLALMMYLGLTISMFFLSPFFTSFFGEVFQLDDASIHGLNSLFDFILLTCVPLPVFALARRLGGVPDKGTLSEFITFNLGEKVAIWEERQLRLATLLGLVGRKTAT